MPKTKVTPDELKQVEDWYQQWARLRPSNRCSFEQWIQLKKSCTNARAIALVDALLDKGGGKYPRTVDEPKAER